MSDDVQCIHHDVLGGRILRGPNNLPCGVSSWVHNVIHPGDYFIYRLGRARSLITSQSTLSPRTITTPLKWMRNPAVCCCCYSAHISVITPCVRGSRNTVHRYYYTYLASLYIRCISFLPSTHSEWTAAGKTWAMMIPCPGKMCCDEACVPTVSVWKTKWQPSNWQGCKSQHSI